MNFLYSAHKSFRAAKNSWKTRRTLRHSNLVRIYAGEVYDNGDKVYFNPIQDGSSWAAHEWGLVKKALSLTCATHVPQSSIFKIPDFVKYCLKVLVQMPFKQKKIIFMAFSCDKILLQP